MHGRIFQSTSSDSRSSVTTAEPDPATQSLLNQSLREQLKQLNQVDVSEQQRVLTLRKSFVDIVEHVVTKTQTKFETLYALHDKAYEQAMLSMRAANLEEEVITSQFVHSHGLVLSPLNCSRTIKDVNRLDVFATGLHKLVNDLLNRQERIHILYPACGPFAPLLLPLLTYYKEESTFDEKQIQVTLIDIHQGATQTLQQLVSDLDLEGFVSEIVHADAITYEPNIQADILLLEASHQGFSKEAHFSIARQLLPFVRESGVMLPCKISIRAALVMGQREFVEQWREQKSGQQIQLSEEALQNRIELGEVFSLDKQSILNAQMLTLPNGQEVLRCNTLRLPNDCEDISHRILVIYSQFHSYDGAHLEQYFSGITSPLPDMSVCIDFEPRSAMPDDLLLKSDDSIEFFYRLNGLTGFMPVKAEM